MSFATRIAELRRQKGESLQDVATAVGATKTHIWELEKGRSANPSLNLVQGMADHFGVSVAYLVDEDIEANDADQQLARMFRQAKNLNETERGYLDDMLQNFLKRQRERGGAS